MNPLPLTPDNLNAATGGADHGLSTIAAIATPPGPGGIGIVRISGPASLSILHTIFTPKHQSGTLTSHRMYYGWVTNPASQQIVDEVLVVYMKAPHTYTREDVVEIHCHGSFLILQEVLDITLQAGARLADPGEFTKYAFLNGRIDLTQAEAVLELLQAKTKEGLNLAINQLQGNLHSEVEAVCEVLISIRAVMEVAIDFPEEDVDIVEPLVITRKLENNVLPILGKLILAADSGKIIREGIAAVIIGRPNVGKSSLLNALLREERAIVTSVPGTTRDTIEEYLNILGMPVRIIDTAGIRDNAGSVEEIGIQRTREKLEQADLALVMLDSSALLQEEDYQLFESAKGKSLILVANKNDISLSESMDRFKEAFPDQVVVAVSAKSGQGIDQLEEAIFSQVTGQKTGWDPGYHAAPNVRHQTAMKHAVDACLRMVEGLLLGLSPDLLAIELQTALDHLGDIVGYTSTEEVLDKIFGEFCIGK